MRIRPLLPLLLLTACAGEVSPGGPSATGGPVPASSLDRLWFAPNVASPDMLRLFTEPERWPRARGRVSVFQFYAQQLAAERAEDCPSCGGNIFPAFADAGAFDRLRSWGIDVAFETGAVKHHTCDGQAAAEWAAGIIDRVAARGGSVAAVAMDEPYIGGEARVNGQTCGYSMAQSAAQTARFLRHLASRHPQVRVGDIEPYPYFRVPQLKAWVDELLTQGVRPAFFHLDIDRNAVKNVRADVTGDLRAMQVFLADRGIPMGVIFWGHELDIPRGSPSPDRAYVEAVLRFVDTVKGAIGAPTHAIVQSWLRSPDGGLVLPRNLPEDDYSHTRLVNDTWERLRPTPPPPATDTAAIRVRHGYQGILGRPTDPSGLEGYAQALRGGLRTADFCLSLFDSDEYRERRAGLSPEELAEALYQGILERAADPSGLASTIAEIRAGRRAAVAAGMLDSPEFQERFLR